MPPDNKPAQREALEQQDQSIKARKHQLFEEPEAAEAGALRPFSVYVRQTPAAPLPQGVKVAIWAVGVLVTLLFLASLFLPRRPRSVRGRSDAGVGPPPTAVATAAAVVRR